jgi:uncharacterized iron-regulated membrane protein
MKPLLSPTLVKNSLTSHSWLGLLTGFFIYLICISGSVVVLSPYLLRWEQPTVQEFEHMSPAAAQRAWDALVAQEPQLSDGALLMLPRENEPRARLASSAGNWYLNEDGSRGASVSQPWTDAMVGLHDKLHLPSGIGEVLVGIFGALLCGLIISGFFSHPRIFRDAFNFRLQGSRHLEQADLHNRLSVWGAPFHLMIAITGAWFGLAGLMYALFSSAFFDGSGEAPVIQEIHGTAPQLEQMITTLDIASALQAITDIAPGARPIYVTLKHINTPQQSILLGALHADRLIYVEQYYFDQAGSYLGNVGYLDGEPGRQAIFSTYRLHFGQYGSVIIELLYVLFGIALAIVAVTGINVWLARRRKRDLLNHLWPGLVWGTPAAMALSALASVLVPSLSGAAIFWVSLLLSSGFALWRRHNDSAVWLQSLSALVLLLVVIAHGWRHQAQALQHAALAINLLLLIFALGFAIPALRKLVRPSRGSSQQESRAL